MEAVIPSGAVPLAPYTPAIKANGLVFCSGQIGMVNGTLVDGVQEQTRVALNGVKALLEAAGSSMSKVVKATVFITDMNNFAAVNEVYATYFEKPHPARSCVAVKELPKAALVEIEVIALQ